jgi:hypothetical protein
LPETFSVGCGTAVGTVFVPVVAVVDGAVGAGGRVLVVEGGVDGLAGAVAGSVAVDGSLVLLVGAAAVRVLGGRVDVVVDSLLPHPLISAPAASPAITHVDSFGNMLSPWFQTPLTHPR